MSLVKYPSYVRGQYIHIFFTIVHGVKEYFTRSALSRDIKHFSLDDTFLQITVVYHYIEHNVSAARHSSNIAYTRNIVSMWNFISGTTRRDRRRLAVPKDTRRQITECRDFFATIRSYRVLLPWQ